MNSDEHLQQTSIAAAEEVLRVIYGDDLQGCAVSLDDVAAVIRPVFQEHARLRDDVGDLHVKGFEAVQLLATPPADGSALTPEDLRTLLGERLDSIRELATKILSATKTGVSGSAAEPPAE